VSAGPAAALALLLAGPVPGTALEQLAAQLAEQVLAEPPCGLHVEAASPELRRAGETVIAAALTARGLATLPVSVADAERAEAAARTRGDRCLVRVRLSLAAGLLHARGDALGTWVNFWSGARPSRPARPAMALQVSAPADAHALSLVATTLAAGSPPKDATELRLEGAVFARLPTWTAAIAGGDLDGDGRAEVVALTDQGVFAFSPQGRLIARREPRGLPEAPARVREPVGALSVAPPGKVAYASGRWARGEELALDTGGVGFRVLRELSAVPAASIGPRLLLATARPGENTLGPPARWVEPEGAASPLSISRPFLTASAFAGPAGAELLLVYPDGRASWTRPGDGARSVEVLGVGAGAALVDLDGDGQAELVASGPELRPQPDVLRALAAPKAGGEPEERWRVEVPYGRVLQVAAADLDGDGAQEVLAAVWLADGTTELWVYRRVRR
jgi:hypothetical protein